MFTRKPGRPARITLTRAVRAEWQKLRTQKTTWAGVMLTALALFLLGVASASGAERAVDLGYDPERQLVNQLYAMTSGINWATLAFLLVGVVSIGNEFGSGLIRVTFTAVPRRGLVMVAKAVVLASTAILVTAATLIVTTAVTTVILADKGYQVTVNYTHLLAFGGACAAVAAYALIGLSVGWILRSTAGGMIVALLVTLGVPFALQSMGLALQSPLAEVVARLMPSIDAVWSMAIPETGHGSDTAQADSGGSTALFTWQAWLILTIWTAVLAAISSVLTLRRTVR